MMDWVKRLEITDSAFAMDSFMVLGLCSYFGGWPIIESAVFFLASFAFFGFLALEATDD